LAFKGGTALRRCYFDNYRFSEDLDFTLLKKISIDEFKSHLEDVYRQTLTVSGIVFRFSRLDSLAHQNSYTFYLSYEGPLPTTNTSKEIKVDVTLMERLFYPMNKKAVLRSYAEYSELPDHAKIQVYPLEEIAAEKTVALLDRARTEPRDLYDLWHLTAETKSIDLLEIKPAIQAKLDFRRKSLIEVRDELSHKESRFKKT